MNGTSYTNPDDIEITTLEDTVYLGMKNDVSFLISDTMNLYEQQSTYNPNMPLRYLMYANDLYDSYIKKNHRNIYSPYIQEIPAPRCVCFYNGKTEKDEVSKLYLSDAYRGEGDIQVSVTMININWGKNRSLLEKCKPLGEYSWFIEEARENQSEGNDLKEAINKALDKMPDDFLIKPYLMANREEVENMCIKEYNEEEYTKLLSAECRARGKEEGEVIGTIKTLISCIKDGILTEDKAAKKANMTLDEFRKAEKLYCS